MPTQKHTPAAAPHPLLKPPRLRPGDTIGIVSPSFGAAGLFPMRLEQGLRQLEQLGYRTRLAPHALEVQGYLSSSAQNRAADLMGMFTDPRVRLILTAIGGDHANQLLPLLDFEQIRANPKIFMGFSDNTVLNISILQCAGLVTFNGPALLTDFAEYPGMLEYSRTAFLETVARPVPRGKLQPAREWTEEFLDWSTGADRQRPRQMQPSAGWTWLKPGQAQGRLLGGCLESLQHLRGTTFWPDWQGAIFFWELSEERPSPADVDSILMDYENMGVLAEIAGMLVGRPYAYTPEEKDQLRGVILERTRAFDFPIITDMDFGHTAPQFVLPLGCLAEVDYERRGFSLLEDAVA